MAATPPRPDTSSSLVPTPGLRWRRVFPGEECQLAVLRRWLASLLPDCPARDDVLSVANELAGNAIQHTNSGQADGWFAAEVTWHESMVQVAVADGGAAAEPHVVEDPTGERGRGLLLVRGMSLRSGFAGDQRGRLVWAHVPWDNPNPGLHPPSQDPYQSAIHEAEAVLKRRFTGVPAWFGRSTLSWWAVVGSRGLVSAPTARELAGLLNRLLGTTDEARFTATRQLRYSSIGERSAAAANPHQQPGDSSDTGPGEQRRRSTGTTTGAPGAADGHASPGWNRLPRVVPRSAFPRYA